MEQTQITEQRLNWWLSRAIKDPTLRAHPSSWTMWLYGYALELHPFLTEKEKGNVEQALNAIRKKAFDSEKEIFSLSHPLFTHFCTLEISLRKLQHSKGLYN